MIVQYDDRYKIKQGAYFAVSERRISDPAPHIHTYLHYHRDMELLFIDEGEAVMQVAGHELRAGKGSLILVNPFEVHAGGTVGGQYAHRCICFDLEQLGPAETADILAGEKGYVNLVEDREVLPYFTACFEAIKNRPVGWELCAKGNLLLLFSLLTDRMVSAVPTKEQVFSRAVLELMEERFAENLTSREAAAYFSYDHSYFCRKFKRSFSQSFSDFLNGLRISKAKELLKTRSVCETALNCGFSNSSYFSRVFKAVTGQSPAEFKKSAIG